MAKAVTQSDIYQMNVLYLKYHTYAAVAKETGRSAGTVKKYIVPNFSVKPIEKKIITLLPPHSFTIYPILLPSESELEDIRELKLEMTM